MGNGGITASQFNHTLPVARQHLFIAVNDLRTHGQDGEHNLSLLPGFMVAFCTS
jgi:hypothetical protein